MSKLTKGQLIELMRVERATRKVSDKFSKLSNQSDILRTVCNQATINYHFRMAHTLLEQDIQAIVDT